jgi:hypothetical protein
VERGTGTAQTGGRLPEPTTTCLEGTECRPGPTMDVPDPAVPFQDLLNDNYCWGWGTLNEHGLQIKSRWDGEESVCVWQSEDYHTAGRSRTHDRRLRLKPQA